jgi:hypothetical protein
MMLSCPRYLPSLTCLGHLGRCDTNRNDPICVAQSKVVKASKGDNLGVPFLVSAGMVLILINNLIILYIKLNPGGFVCVCVCVSGIEIHTIGPILTKFGMGA